MMYDCFIYFITTNIFRLPNYIIMTLCVSAWPPLQCSGVKWPGCEDHHSPPCSVEVKNEWICTSTSPVCLHGMQRDNFTSAFLSAST